MEQQEQQKFELEQKTRKAILEFLSTFENDATRRNYDILLKKVKMILYDKDALIEFIEKQKPAMKKNLYKVSSSFYKHFKLENEFLRKELVKITKKIEDENGDEKFDFDFNELTKKYNAISDIQGGNDKLLLYFLLFLPTLRSDYLTIKTKNYNKETDNYVDLENKHIHFNHMVKNDKQYKMKLTEKDIETIKTLNKWNTSDYLFQINGRSNNAFVKKIKTISMKYLKQPYSLNDYRKIYSNRTVDKNAPLRTQFNQIAINARCMNNSVKTQLNYYVKNTEKEETFTILKVNGKTFKVYGTIEEMDEPEQEEF